MLIALLALTLAAPADGSPDAPVDEVPAGDAPVDEVPLDDAAPAPAPAASEPDPWAPAPAAEQVPPSEAAVLAQQNPDLAATLEAPRPGKRGYGKYESPQRFAFEVKLGPYLPDVDRNYSGSGYGPYAKVFGKTDDRGAVTGEPKKVVMPVLHFEWQIINPADIGPIGVGISGGFMRDKANAPFADPPTDPDAPLRSTADEITFSTVPIALQGVFRLELLADRLRVPIVPYAKGGLAYAFWWSRNANRNLSRSSTGEKALGGVWGWQLNVGAMLRLDFLDIGSTRNLDRTTGINHTYIFGEYQLSRINNFGKAQSMSLGDSTWFAGLAIEF